MAVDDIDEALYGLTKADQEVENRKWAIEQAVKLYAADRGWLDDNGKNINGGEAVRQIATKMLAYVKDGT